MGEEAGRKVCFPPRTGHLQRAQSAGDTQNEVMHVEVLGKLAALSRVKNHY